MNKTYFCIDLKSFYATVECVERGLDPMTAKLVVADKDRSDKTICLAVSPALKALGVKNRCRVFEIPEGIDYIMATPRMQKYIDYSAEIYGLYLKYFSKEDIHVYSIDEAFIDVTPYLKLYKKEPKELALFILNELKETLGVVATCGIGSNLYLTKIALDITAKHSDDFIGILDEESYKRKLWDHQPLTDFWRIGKGIQKRLNEIGIYTMRDIAHASEASLYKLFGIDAELLIDHAWGREPVTIKDIKNYKPKKSSKGSGQVLMRDYTYREAEIIIREMVTELCLSLKEEGFITNSVTLTLRYSKKEKTEKSRITVSFDQATNSDRIISDRLIKEYYKVVKRDFMIRKISVHTNNKYKDTGNRQISFFDLKLNSQADEKLEESIINLKSRFGENAVIKALDLQKAATTIERNDQIGGHKSGRNQKNEY